MVHPTESETTVFLQELLNRGIVNNPRIAVAIAELVIANAYGPEELDRQKPLHATEQSDRWIIEGSFNKDKTQEGRGPARVSISKRDAQILDLRVPYIIPLPPEAVEVMKKKKELR